jgi:hypothetical protein
MKAFERKSGLSGSDIDSDKCARIATRDESDAIEWLRSWPPERAS